MSEFLKEAAKAGDAQALETLMNQSFKSQGILIKVHSSGPLLKILIQGSELPDRKLASSIKKGLSSINPQGVEKVFLKAQETIAGQSWSTQWMMEAAPSLTAPVQPAGKNITLSSKKNESKWYQKSWLIILLLVLFPFIGVPLIWTSRWPKKNKIVASTVGGIWLLFVMFSGTSDTPVASNREDESSQTTDVTTQKEREEREVDERSDTENSAYGLNDFVDFDGRAIVAQKIEKTDSIQIDNQFADPINGEIIIVHFLVKNTSNESGSLYFSQFKLIDSQGREYSEITDMTYSMWRDELGLTARGDDYYPGENRKELAAFRVAPGAAGFKLEWKGKVIDLSN